MRMTARDAEMALGTSNAVIMRARDAATDPYKSVSETIGSGPFRFVRSEWNPGAKVDDGRIAPRSRQSHEFRRC
jgi:hypothetical protein